MKRVSASSIRAQHRLNRRQAERAGSEERTVVTLPVPLTVSLRTYFSRFSTRLADYESRHVLETGRTIVHLVDGDKQLVRANIDLEDLGRALGILLPSERLETGALGAWVELPNVPRRR